ncbi:uncharacterized protein TRIADDRAFT_24253, partial [Trichoplax adhaerens]
ISGAGISAESGIPTFRGEGGYWRIYQATDLATPSAFTANPSLIWEFYSYRREFARTKEPNKGHYAVAELEKRFALENKSVIVITQNIDRLHHKAGSKNVLELHGSLYETRCTKCYRIEENWDSPIAPSLAGKGLPDPDTPDARIPVEELPRCKACGGLLRPNVIWFGESLNEDVLDKTWTAMDACDFCLLIGTSSVVYPAAGFAPELATRGVPVAEFNLEDTPATTNLRFHFKGKAGETLPAAIVL